VPDELWTDVRDIVQETGIKIIPKKKKCKKAKWLSEEALQIAVKRRDVKSNGEKERYKHLNAEFQGIAGEIRNSSSDINALKQRKTTEWERLEISPRKLEIPRNMAAAAAAKSLQSCPTLCDPIYGSPPGSPLPGILQARTREWVAISFSNA
jgi:hypothetical protein